MFAIGRTADPVDHRWFGDLAVKTPARHGLSYGATARLQYDAQGYCWDAFVEGLCQIAEQSGRVICGIGRETKRDLTCMIMTSDSATVGGHIPI